MLPPSISRNPSSSLNASSSSASDAAERGSHNPFISFPHPERSPACAPGLPACSSSKNEERGTSEFVENVESLFQPDSDCGNRVSRTWRGSSLLARLRGNSTHCKGADFHLSEARGSSLSITSEQTLQDEPQGVQRLCSGWRIVVLGSWFNVLLILLPITIIVHKVKENSNTIVCILCIFSMLPLVRLHDIGTSNLALRIGGSRTGLLNASMSNSVELVVAIIALNKCELRVVQSTLIGAILSKLLLVVGICFFAGGLCFSEQIFDVTATQINISLLSISVNAMLIPAAFHFASNAMQESSLDQQRRAIISMSRAVSVVLIFIYIGFIIFQLHSHSHLYRDPAADQASPRLFFRPRNNASTKNSSPLPSESPSEDALVDRTADRDGSGPINPSVTSPDSLAQPYETPVKSTRSWPPSESQTRTYSILSHTPPRGSPKSSSAITEASTPQLSLLLNIALLLVVTAMIGVNVEMLVSSMDGLSSAISKEWLALILLPAVSALAECIGAINVSVKDQLTLAMSVAIGSTIQTALFIIPTVVLLGMVTNKPLALLFDPFESLVLYLGVTTLNYVVGDGKSNWMEGAILICLYIIIGVSFWFYPGSNFSSTLAACS